MLDDEVLAVLAGVVVTLLVLAGTVTVVPLLVELLLVPLLELVPELLLEPPPVLGLGPLLEPLLELVPEPLLDSPPVPMLPPLVLVPEPLPVVPFSSSAMTIGVALGPL